MLLGLQTLQEVECTFITYAAPLSETSVPPSWSAITELGVWLTNAGSWYAPGGQTPNPKVFSNISVRTRRQELPEMYFWKRGRLRSGQDKTLMRWGGTGVRSSWPISLEEIGRGSARPHTGATHTVQTGGEPCRNSDSTYPQTLTDTQANSVKASGNQ